MKRERTKAQWCSTSTHFIVEVVLMVFMLVIGSQLAQAMSERVEAPTIEPTVVPSGHRSV